MPSCYFTENSMTPACWKLWDRAQKAENTIWDTIKFLSAYANEEALTFADPQTGKLVSANKSVRAFARACLQGPLDQQKSD